MPETNVRGHLAIGTTTHAPLVPGEAWIVNDATLGPVSVDFLMKQFEGCEVAITITMIKPPDLTPRRQRTIRDIGERNYDK